jgi:hypothetical protein
MPEMETPRGVDAVRVEIEVCDGPFGPYRQIVMTIRPTATPVQVARAYRLVRNAEILGGKRLRRAKRPPALLLAFVRERRGDRWSATMAAWNARYPDYAYTRVTNLQRDYARARQRADEGVLDV